MPKVLKVENVSVVLLGHRWRGTEEISQAWLYWEANGHRYNVRLDETTRQVYAHARIGKRPKDNSEPCRWLNADVPKNACQLKLALAEMERGNLWDDALARVRARWDEEAAKAAAARQENLAKEAGPALLAALEGMVAAWEAIRGELADGYAAVGMEPPHVTAARAAIDLARNGPGQED